MKATSWMHILLLLFFLVTAYGIPWMIRVETDIEYNHLYILLSTFAVWTVVLGATFTELGSGHYRKHLDLDRPWWKGLMSGFGALAGSATWFLGMVFMMLGNILPNLNENMTVVEIASRDARISTMFTVFVCSFLYYLFCLLFIWTKARVAEGTVVLLQDRLLYPGTRFTLFPIFRERFDVFSEQVNLSIKELELDCKDGSYTVQVNTSVLLDLQFAKRLCIHTIDWKSVMSAAKQIIADTLTAQAIDANFGELTLKERAMSFMVAGFPMKWNGKTTIIVTS